MPARGKHSSLYDPFVSEERKKFYDIGLRMETTGLSATAGAPGINFTNILQAAFSYISFLCSFGVLTIWVSNFLAQGFWRKSCS